MMKYSFVVVLFVVIIIIASSAKADAEPPTLLVIGDSLTRGLSASSETKTYKVIAANHFGYNLVSTYVRRLEELESVWPDTKKANPDIIIVEIGLNDVSAGTIPESQWADRYGAILDDMRATGARVIVCTMFWGGIKPSYPDYQKYLRYNGYIKKAAKDRGISVADLWPATYGNNNLLSSPDQFSAFPIDGRYIGDNFHPNNAGHSVISAALIEQIENKIYLPIIK